MAYIYFMTINGEEYNAIFKDHFEAADFLDENDQAGDVVIIHKTEEVNDPARLLEVFGRTKYVEEMTQIIWG